MEKREEEEEKEAETERDQFIDTILKYPRKSTFYFMCLWITHVGVQIIWTPVPYYN